MFCLFDLMLYVRGKHFGMVSYITTLFLGKPLGGSLPVLSANSLASNLQLALLESAEKGNYFSTKECA